MFKNRWRWKEGSEMGKRKIYLGYLLKAMHGELCKQSL
jgi:hypothetical protein